MQWVTQSMQRLDWYQDTEQTAPAAGLNDLIPSAATPVTPIWYCQPRHGAGLPGTGGRRPGWGASVLWNFFYSKLFTAEYSLILLNLKINSLLGEFYKDSVFLTDLPQWLHLCDEADQTKWVQVIKIAELPIYPSLHVMPSPSFKRIL